jgi:hypothetical protein
MREALCDITAVTLLRHAEDNFHETDFRSRLPGKQDFS